MLGNRQFYHETIRKIIVAFGTLFNDIHIVRKNNSGDITQSMKVPLAYGPKQKFLAKIHYVMQSRFLGQFGKTFWC